MTLYLVTVIAEGQKRSITVFVNAAEAQKYADNWNNPAPNDNNKDFYKGNASVETVQI